MKPTNKTERVGLRMNEFTKRQIELAASARQQSLSAFIRESARTAAQRALGGEQIGERPSMEEDGEETE